MNNETTVNQAAAIKLLNDKDTVVGRPFLVKDKVLGMGKNGKSFLTVLLGDSTGHIDSKLWDNVEEVSSVFEIGDIVNIKGVIQIYNNRKQLVIHKLEKNNDTSIDRDSFSIKEKTIDTHGLYSELSTYVQKISSTPIKQLCLETLQDTEIKALLLQAPAAKTIHHAKRGGLLEHIVSICKLMDFVGSHYSTLNKDLLFFGALFHDLGKIWELEINSQNQVSYTQKGQLLGHMQLACELIDKKSLRILAFPDELRVILKHIVLGHHGKLEYGSPKLPMLPEAVVVAMIDDFDSKMDTMLRFITLEQGSGESWSRFNEHFERFFYIENTKSKWE